ncbi:hypothetical protein FQZ97_1109780 [compost metagenome]
MSEISPIFTRFTLGVGTVQPLINAVRHSLFKRPTGYFVKATSPCVVAYRYARIRRLVRLEHGLYRFSTTAYQWSGLVARFA